MKTLPYYNITAQQVAVFPVKMMKLEATLKDGATAGLFLQLHDANGAPANGAAPVKCWPAAECGYKEFERGELVFSAGCYLALSTTAATLTLATGGSDKMDILNVELVDPEAPAGTSVGGDLTTAVNSLQVWADASGPKRLIQLEIDATGAGLNYAMLFAADNPVNGDKPVDQFTIKAGAVLTGKNALNFGVNGRDMVSQGSDGVNHNGCTIKISSTPGTLTVTGDTVKMKATYK